MLKRNCAWTLQSMNENILFCRRAKNIAILLSSAKNIAILLLRAKNISILLSDRQNLYCLLFGLQNFNKTIYCIVSARKILQYYFSARKVLQYVCRIVKNIVLFLSFSKILTIQYIGLSAREKYCIVIVDENNNILYIVEEF